MGEQLHDACKEFGLIQHVSNIDGMKVREVPRIADHVGLLISFRTPACEGHVVHRTGWLCRKAAWQHLNSDLGSFDAFG